MRFSVASLAIAALAAFSLGAADELEVVNFKLPAPAVVPTPPVNLFKDTTADPKEPPRAPWLAPKGTANLAYRKAVISSDSEPTIGNLNMITDGDKAATDGSFVELAPALQWVQVDLGKTCTIYGVLVWHQHSYLAIYRDVIAQVSDDRDFISNVTTIYNNDQDNTAGLGIGKDREYVEKHFGRLMEAKGGVKGRYVRLYSNGNTAADTNHYTEVEVYGIPG